MTNILELTHITKEFPGVRALDNVDFSVDQGEIHGLVGENGAGKSTLIKIIAGVYQPDAGEIRINGTRHRNLTPSQIEGLGIQFIHQDLFLVPEFTVAQSLFLGQEIVSSLLPLLSKRKMARQAEAFIQETMGIELPGNALIRDLSVAQRQLVQIAKSLMAKPAIVAFDEPTAPLASREVERLFEIINGLKAQGITIIYISHYLNEITDICDRVTVLRNGLKVDTLPIAQTSHDEIVQLMVGREIGTMFPDRAETRQQDDAPLLNVQGLTIRGTFQNLSFSVQPGEIVGLTGLIGSGVEELVETLYGLSSADAGTMDLNTKAVSGWSPVRAVQRGMGLVPKDRRREGLVLNMSVNDNINLASLDDVAHSGFTRPRAALTRTLAMIQNLAIRPPRPQTTVRYLSGGNQQKVVISKWLTSETELYLLHEPTTGVDVGAKAEIYQLVHELVAEGKGVLLVSSDLPELLGMSDRILVMFRGEIVKELKVNHQQGMDAHAQLDQPEGISEDIILFWATGGKERA
ncbi:MAG: sugar ABC transporter ATP-binding protein [Chloroflexota bacterium]